MAVRFAELNKWDTLSAWIGIGFHVGYPQVPVRELFSVRWQQATEEQIATGEVSMLDRVSFDGMVFCGVRQETRMEQFIARPGDIVVSKIRARQGSVGIVQPEHGKVGVSIHYRVLIPDTNKVDTTYAWLALRTAYCRAQFLAATGGAMKGEISEEALLDIRLPHPIPSTQQAIVHRWQAAKEEAQAAWNEAEAMERDATQTFLHGLGLRPTEKTANKSKAFAVRWHEIERWGVEMVSIGRGELITHQFPLIPIKQICRIGSGGTPSRQNPSYYGGDIPWIKTTEVRNCEIFETEEKIAQAGLVNSSAKLYPAGSLIVAMYGQGATRGRTAKLSIPAATNQACCVLHNFDACIDPDFVWFYLMCQYEQLRAMASGNNQPNLNAEMIADFEIPIPSLELQKALASKFLSARTHAARLRAEAEALQARAVAEVEAAILGRPAELAAHAPACEDSTTKEPRHDHPTTETPRPASEAMARRPSGRGQPAGGVSPAAGVVRPELDGAGAGAGGPGPSPYPADSTRPLDATRELATAAGSLTYTEVSERLAVNIVRCLDALLDAEPEAVAITPDWLRDVHLRLAGELFPDWAGRFRATDVQVGTHLPPPAHDVAVQVRDFCLDLAERLHHLSGAESIADLLAWVDWRFQWIHPFKDFNGRVGRILLVALTYKLGLPPMDPAGLADKEAYFAALREADAGDLMPLREIWLRRLEI